MGPIVWYNAFRVNSKYMKNYRALLVLLRGLMYVKRFLWWFGARAGRGLAWLFSPVLWLLLWVKYKINYYLKKKWPGSPLFIVLERGILQLALLGVLFFVVLPQSRLLVKADPAQAGQQTIMFALLGSSETTQGQDVIEEPVSAAPALPTPTRQAGSLQHVPGSESGAPTIGPELFSSVAGGAAVLKPSLLPGATVAAAERQNPITYEVQIGDSLGLIAYRFGLRLDTVLWENNLTERSVLRPGLKLTILPTDGVMVSVKKGDTIQKIAKLYAVKTDAIIEFNKLPESGALAAGQKLMVPGGVKPRTAVAAVAPARARTSASAQQIAAPSRSLAAPSASGFVWPAGIRTITQYFNPRHHAVDIAGPWQTPNYAAKAGTVEKSQCGWNNGYGCEIIIDHGGGVKTLYGHNSVLLVSVGDYVEAGQTIGLMGNTGNVRGLTGIHLHFEVIINGVRVNPLGYIR